MKHIKSTILVFLAFCLFSPTVLAQNTSTQGKEFWLSFMHNGFRDHTNGGGWVINQVLISAKRNCTGTVSNPLTGWSQEFNARPNSITTVEIPETQGYHNQSTYETISQKAIKVEANDTISVYCTNIAYVSFDASFVLPYESLGDEYIIQSFDQSTSPYANDYVLINETSAIVIVATENNTIVDITPTCPTLGGHEAAQTFSISMNAGETYHLRSTRTGNSRDLSGTHILASDCKKIAVFNGNTLTCIPVTMGNGYDHVFEQAMPLRSWGKNFVVTGSMGRNRDFIKITSSTDNNLITKNGEELVTLGYGQSYTFPMPESEGSCFLQAEQPCAVYLFNNSSYDQNINGGNGDPSMVWIAPVEQRINNVTFSTFDHANINIETHSVNIIVNTEDIDQVYFDGELISPDMFQPVNGNGEYSYTRMNINHSVHQITCENGFNAHVYGFGHAKGYAYLVGSNAIDLSTKLTINDLEITSNETFPYCAEEAIRFNAEINYDEYAVLWDFGDGITSTSNPTTHTYHNKDLFEVKLMVTTLQGGCLSSSSDTLKFYIDARQQYIIENDDACSGQLYSGYGFTNIPVHHDTILARLQDNPVNPECKDSLLVYVNVGALYDISINDSRCWHGEPDVYNANGFNFVYDSPGIFEHTITHSSFEGCDSVVTLTLTVSDRVIGSPVDHHECGNSYTWNGQTYYSPGVYEQVLTGPTGCDSVAILNLTMGTSQTFEFDTITCDSFIWDGIEYDLSGDYARQYSTFDGCDSTVTMHLDLNYIPVPTEIYPADLNNQTPHWVVTATEFQVNSYDFVIWETEHPYTCHWDSVTWQFEDPDVQWVLEPDSTTHPAGKRCRIYVLNHMEDTVWLDATVYNRCAPQGILLRYWFVCSYYGIEEQEESTADFSVVPNPNDGQMTLRFEKLTGKIDLKVYDIMGNLVDQFSTYSNGGPEIVQYDMKTHSEGIYFFVAIGKEGIVTKKVVIQK